MELQQIREALVHELRTLEEFYAVADPVIDYIQRNTPDVVPARTKGYSHYDLVTVAR